MTDVTVRPARAEDTDAVADLLAQAFAQDPFIEDLFGSGDDAGDRARQLFALDLRVQYLPDGAVDVAEIGGTMTGAALWSPPSGSSGSALAELRLVPRYLRLLGRHFPAAVISELRSRRHHPRFPHWYLYLLGVAPGSQGRGIGGALLEHRIARFGPGEAAYLEATTPGSARMYGRHGFVPLGGVPLSRGRTMTGMWRPANT